VCAYASLRNNTHCSELHHLFNSRLQWKEKKWKKQTDIQAVGYCFNKDKRV